MMVPGLFPIRAQQRFFLQKEEWNFTVDQRTAMRKKRALEQMEREEKRERAALEAAGAAGAAAPVSE